MVAVEPDDSCEERDNETHSEGYGSEGYGSEVFLPGTGTGRRNRPGDSAHMERQGKDGLTSPIHMAGG